MSNAQLNRLVMLNQLKVAHIALDANNIPRACVQNESSDDVTNSVVLVDEEMTQNESSVPVTHPVVLFVDEMVQNESSDPVTNLELLVDNEMAKEVNPFDLLKNSI